jgi:ribonuclease E
MGTIRSVESMALAVLRLIGEEVRKERTTRVVAQLPVDVSTFLINEKREWLHQLESQRAIDIVLVPDPNMQTPNYSIRRVRDDEMTLAENTVTSYQIAGTGTAELDFKTQAERLPPAAPAAVQPIAPAAPVPTPPAPAPRGPRAPGFWSRLVGLFSGGGAAGAAAEAAVAPRREERHGGHHGRDDRGGRRPHRGERGPRRDRERDRDRGRNRDRHRDSERGERHDRQRDNRDEQARHRERPAEAPRPPQAAQGPRQEQAAAEGEGPRRRRRRRGRGGRGRERERQESYRQGETQPDVQAGDDATARGEAVPAALSAEPAFEPAPPSAREPAPPMPSSAPAPEPKSGGSYTVWSSQPGESHHFGPKD